MPLLTWFNVLGTLTWMARTSARTSPLQRRRYSCRREICCCQTFSAKPMPIQTNTLKATSVGSNLMACSKTNTGAAMAPFRQAMRTLVSNTMERNNQSAHVLALIPSPSCTASLPESAVRTQVCSRHHPACSSRLRWRVAGSAATAATAGARLPRSPHPSNHHWETEGLRRDRQGFLREVALLNGGRSLDHV